ncbi:hypothetical protein GGR51DRAFT_574580 [Nemania sp. FL0031]|nr:hypothetical protein GGR51DRAFT_574580 [Nemania sp. FL0031]
MSTPGGSRSSGAASAAAAPQETMDEETLEEYADIFRDLRANDEARARAGDVRGLWTTANNTISHLSSHFVTEPHVDFSGGWTFQLQNLWHLYYVTGKYCAEDSVAPAVLQLLETSQRGLLTRSQISGSTGAIEVEHAPVVVHVGGHVIQQYLWQDLPFLVPDMTSYWVQDCARMSSSQRVRVCTFWASLVAASSAPWAYGLCRIALMVLRDTLETQRRLVRAGVEPGGEDSENAGRTTDMLTIADLLRAAHAWLARAGGRITQLCEAGDSNAATALTIPVPEDVSQLGPLAQAAGIQAVPGGFSSQRWFFWLRRLDEIGAEASPQGLADSSVMGMTSPFVQKVREEKQMARRVAYDMIYAASQSNSTIVQELMRMGRVPLDS